VTLKTPLGRVLGLGSAKDGTAHWWSQRLSAVALAPLTLWFAVTLLGLPDFSHATVTSLMAGPLDSALLIIFLGALVYHSHLGVQVVVEDYVRAPSVKIPTLVLLALAHLVLGVTGVVAILRVSLGVMP